MKNQMRPIADTIPQQERGFAIGIFMVGILAGPVVGPVPGSFLAAANGWRWILWLISILVRYKPLFRTILTNNPISDGLYHYFVLHFLERVISPVLLGRKTAKLRKQTGNKFLRTK